MSENNNRFTTSIIYVLLALIINMSVNVHDSMINQDNLDNEIETLVELILVSCNSDWVLADSPDGADEDHLVKMPVNFSLYTTTRASLLTYYPHVSNIKFYTCDEHYTSFPQSPLIPPPIA